MFLPQNTLRQNSCNAYEHLLKNLKGEQSQIIIAFLKRHINMQYQMIFI